MIIMLRSQRNEISLLSWQRLQIMLHLDGRSIPESVESVADRLLLHDLKFMAGRIDDPAVARHLDDKQKESFVSGRQFLATRSGQQVYYVKDPIDILQSAYSFPTSSTGYRLDSDVVVRR